MIVKAFYNGGTLERKRGNLGMARHDPHPLKNGKKVDRKI